ncbi:hypothetical protein CFT13S00388_07980 [Campylobacter fetus subsp. testudinum]|uniref:hypothetical protein n=1 Tax=Campylobacter fetus TaxID=196 RepID=UPI000818973B|nr:hypothetical protein [Campylobacter fetus]OCR86684.1 hypothetical protein CFT13S00388_07980 [Campylobacter fetus subsp. testudinum]
MNITRKELKIALLKIYKKDMVNSVLCGRENVGTSKIRELQSIAPNIPVEIWLNPKEYLAKQKEKK